jgi:hypothetical protein
MYFWTFCLFNCRKTQCHSLTAVRRLTIRMMLDILSRVKRQQMKIEAAIQAQVKYHYANIQVLL